MSLAEAERAWSLAKSAPLEALDRAETLLAGSGCDERTIGLALAARGRAHFELGNNDRAVVDLRSASMQVPGSDRPRVAIALAAALAAGGDPDGAIALLGGVADMEDGPEDGSGPTASPAVHRGVALSQMGYLLMHRGDLLQGADALERAIGLLEGHADQTVALARSLLNLGYCTLMTGNFDRSLVILERAITISAEASEPLLVAGCLQNRAYALSCLGELPAALVELERAREGYDASGDPGRMLSTLYDDFAETYRLAGLTGDAVRHAELALEPIAGGGNLEQEADSTYRLAVCLLDHGHHERAIEMAERARVMFERAGRTVWENRATLVVLEAASTESTGSDGWYERAASVLDQLQEAEWSIDALRLRNRMALIGLRIGDRELVGRFLIERLPTSDQSVVGRLECLLHRTIADLHHGGTGEDVLREAWSTLHAHRQRLADPELRAGSGRLAEAFRFLALVGAEASGEPAVTLAAEEQWRAGSLRLPRARPSRDPMVADTSRRLRDLSRRARETDSPDPEMERQIRRLEDRLRRASHQAAATTASASVDGAVEGAVDDASDSPTVDRRADGPRLIAALTGRLDGRQLVEWFEHRGTVHGIRVQGERVEHWEVGRAAELHSAADRIRRDLARLLYAPSAGGVDHRWDRIRDRAAELGRRLLGPSPSGTGLVLCPPGPLQELPWPLLVPRRGTPIALAFSATAWLRSERRLAGAGDLAEPSLWFGTGPDLDETHQDHRTAHRRFPTTSATALADRQALTDAIGTADLLHIAAHGTFRAASPMFSSLRLADGDFALHELAEFDRFPAVVALAACDAGRSLHLGEVAEQLGAAPAWLGAGVHTVIAPVCAVPDEATAEVFNRFYDALPGRTPAEALARVWDEVADAEPALAGTAAAILCFGNGGPTIGPPERGSAGRG